MPIRQPNKPSEGRMEHVWLWSPGSPGLPCLRPGGGSNPNPAGQAHASAGGPGKETQMAMGQKSASETGCGLPWASILTHWPIHAEMCLFFLGEHETRSNHRILWTPGLETQLAHGSHRHFPSEKLRHIETTRTSPERTPHRNSTHKTGGGGGTHFETPV